MDSMTPCKINLSNRQHASLTKADFRKLQQSGSGIIKKDGLIYNVKVINSNSVERDQLNKGDSPFFTALYDFFKRGSFTTRAETFEAQLNTLKKEVELEDNIQALTLKIDGLLAAPPGVASLFSGEFIRIDAKPETKTKLKETFKRTCEQIYKEHKKATEALQAQVHKKLGLLKAQLLTGAITQIEFDAINKSVSELENKLVFIKKTSESHLTIFRCYMVRIVEAKNSDLIGAYIQRLVTTNYELTGFLSSLDLTDQNELVPKKDAALAAYASFFQMQLRVLEEVLSETGAAEIHILLSTPILEGEEEQNQLLRAKIHKENINNFIDLISDHQSTVEQFQEEKGKLSDNFERMVKQVKLGIQVIDFLKTIPAPESRKLAPYQGHLDVLTQWQAMCIHPLLMNSECFDTALAEVNNSIACINMSFGLSDCIAMCKESKGYQTPSGRFGELTKLASICNDPKTVLPGNIIESVNAHMELIALGEDISLFLKGLKEMSYYGQDTQARINSLIVLKDICCQGQTAIQTRTGNNKVLLSVFLNDFNNVNWIKEKVLSHVAEIKKCSPSDGWFYGDHDLIKLTHEDLVPVLLDAKVKKIQEEVIEVRKMALDATEKLLARDQALKRAMLRVSELSGATMKFREKAKQLHRSFSVTGTIVDWVNSLWKEEPTMKSHLFADE